MSGSLSVTVRPCRAAMTVVVAFRSEFLTSVSRRTVRGMIRADRTVGSYWTRVCVSMPCSHWTVEPSWTEFTGSSGGGVSVIPRRADPTGQSLVISYSSMGQGLIPKVTSQGHIASLGTVEWINTQDGRLCGIWTVVSGGTDGRYTCHRWAVVTWPTIRLNGGSRGTLVSGSTGYALGVDGVVRAVVPRTTEVTVGVVGGPGSVSHSTRWAQDRFLTGQAVESRGAEVCGVISHSCFIAVVTWLTGEAVCLGFRPCDIPVP